MSDAFTDCYEDFISKNPYIFEAPLLKLFRTRTKRNKTAVENLANSFNGEQIQTRMNAFFFFADKLKKDRKKVHRNRKVFKNALNAFLNPERKLHFEGVFGKIILNWNRKDAVLRICLERLKENITYPGLSNEMVTKVRRDEHVTLAGSIGMFLGKSKTPLEFINILSQKNLLAE